MNQIFRRSINITRIKNNVQFNNKIYKIAKSNYTNSRFLFLNFRRNTNTKKKGLKIFSINNLAILTIFLGLYFVGNNSLIIKTCKSYYNLCKNNLNTLFGEFFENTYLKSILTKIFDVKKKTLKFIQIIRKEFETNEPTKFFLDTKNENFNKSIDLSTISLNLSDKKKYISNKNFRLLIEDFNKLLIFNDPKDTEYLKNLKSQIVLKIFKISEDLDLLNKGIDEEVSKKIEKIKKEIEISYNELKDKMTNQLIDEFNNEKKSLENKLNIQYAIDLDSNKNNMFQSYLNLISAVKLKQLNSFNNDISKKICDESKKRLLSTEKLFLSYKKLKNCFLMMKSNVLLKEKILMIQDEIFSLSLILFSNDSSKKISQIENCVTNLNEHLKNSKNSLLKVSVNCLNDSLKKKQPYSIKSIHELILDWDSLSNELRKSFLIKKNSGLIDNVMSFFFSKMLLSREISSMNTCDIESIILKVRSDLINGRLDNAVENVSMLNSFSKKLANDWILDLTKRLEVDFLYGLISNTYKLI